MFLAPSSSRAVDPYLQTLLLRVSLSRLGGKHRHLEGNEDEPLTLAGRLLKVLESFDRYGSITTRQYVGHILRLVKSYWPRTPLDSLGQGTKADCTDDQFK